LQKYIKDNSFFIVCNDSSILVSNFLHLNQELLKLNLVCYRVNNKLLQNIYKDSIFNNYLESINGSILLVFSNKKNMCFNFRDIKSTLIKLNINIFCIYFNYKIYSIQQLNNFHYFNYEKNILLLYDTFINFINKPSYKFIKLK
jgi:hypothetical protein